jgi:TonB family protein
MKAIVHREEDRAKAMLLSLMLHLGLLALFMFYKFAAPEKSIDPPPILIEMSSLGGGGTDAAEGEPDRGMNSTSAPDAPVPDEVAQEPVKPTPTPPAASEVPPKTTPTTEDPEVAALRREQEEAKRKQQEEQQKIAEQKRKEKEAADAKARQEADRKKKIAGSGLGGGTGGTGSGSGTGGKPGNQGAPGGTGSNPNGTRAGPGGGTGGGSGTGIGASVGGGLGNRKRVKEVLPEYNSQESGKVQVKICVDSEGNVTEATPSTSGSTTSSGTLREAARKAALRWKFVAAPGTDKQCGDIVFNFKLQ